MKIKEALSFVKYTIFILIYLFCSPISIAQVNNPEYLFDEFESAYLISSNKLQYHAEINYSFELNEIVFKDKNDNNQIKVLDPIMEIRSIKVKDRIFLIDEKGLTKEVLQNIPLIMVQYKGKMKPGGKNAGYGGESETAAIDSYSHFYGNSGGPAIELTTSKYKLMGINKVYEIDRVGKLKTFITQSKFTKLYPKEVQKELDAYIYEQKIEFNDPEQVVELYNYAERLAKQ